MRYVLLAFLAGQVYAAEFELTENTIMELSLASNPSLQQIEATFLDSKVKSKELGDKFGFAAYGGYNHINTNEKAAVPFIPIYTTINQYQVGVKKYTKYGVVLDVNTAVDVRSGASNTLSFKDITTTSHEFGVQVDLWKDFMGRISKTQFETLQDLEKKDEYQAQISKSVFLTNIRKLYWNIVANNQKMEITNRLTRKSEEQLKDAKRRRADSVADTAEVARFESLVHQRRGQLINLKYQREILLRNLRENFPTLNGKEVQLGKYNPDKTLFEVLACTTKISEEQTIPFSSTSYDEVIALLRKIQNGQSKIDETYDDIDLKLDLKLRQVGVASESSNNEDFEGNYSDSLDDIADNDRSAMVAGLMLTIPFGEDRAKTKTVKEAYTEKSFGANISQMDAKVRAAHVQIKKSVVLLTELMQEQKANSTQLQIRVKEMKKKYGQARIPEYVLIQDQDSLLQSDLGIVDIQLMVLETVLDYFSVFLTTTPVHLIG